MRIATVVVTFNRKEFLKKNLVALRDQSVKIDKIYIIDNASTDGTENEISNFLTDNMEYIRLEENTGGSGGFYFGLKKAYEEGYDYIWGMDDDAIPQNDALEELLIELKKMKSDVCLWSNCNNDFFSGEVKSVEHMMFVGFLLSKSIIERIGLPRKDFFIYLDDYEYSERMKKNGIKIFKVKKSIIKHKDSAAEYYPTKRILFFKLKWIKLNDMKMYYWVRNYVKLYKWSQLSKYIVLFIKIPNIFIRTMLFNYKQLGVVSRAVRDGILQREGKTF